MRYLPSLIVLLTISIALSINNADAQLSGNKAFTLSGTGYAISNTSVSDSSLEMTFSMTQSKNKSDFRLQDGVIMVDQKDWDLSELSGSVLQNGKLFKFSSKATDQQGSQATLNGIAKLIDSTPSESIYTFSGVLIDSTNQKTKLVYTTKTTEFIIKKITQTQKSSTTIKILKGAANPEEATYKTQIGGFKFNFVSEDRITIPPGETITFVNEDVVSHSLKSGTANYNSHKKTFNADGIVSSGNISPGKSWTVKFDQRGFYRLFDPEYQHIDLTVFVMDTSKISKTKTPLN